MSSRGLRGLRLLAQTCGFAADGQDSLSVVSQTELFLAIVGLIVLEIYHLKWIWWEHWMCRSCGTQNKNCSCGPPPKWFKYL